MQIKCFIFFAVWFLMISCRSEIGPDIFDHLDYTVLSGKRICIDPGHQRIQDTTLEPIAPGSSIMKYKCSSGTSGIVSKVPEYIIVLDVGIKLKNLLELHGAVVVMTRDNHDVNISNIERAEIGNNSQSDIMIRVHADGSINQNDNGISVLVPRSTFIKDNLVITKSRSVGHYILQGVIRNTGAKNNGIIERDDLTGFNWSRIPVILIEMGFMTNEQEDALLNSEKYQDKIVQGITDGLAAYFLH
jgi:N-acetylmuramoyl-L-alanine amidase